MPFVIKERQILYNIWRSMMQRCYNKKSKSYLHYGKRGIFVCKKWHQYYTFEKEMGYRPAPDLTLERIDNNKGYNKRNCKWATVAEQNRNMRRNIRVKYKGKIQTLKEWERELGVGASTFWSRIKKHNWDILKALKTPVRLKTIYLYKGKISTITNLIKGKGLSYKTFYRRIKKGWSVEEALAIPAEMKGIKCRK